MNIQKLEKWDHWLKTIVFETERLIEDRYFYKEMTDIVIENPDLSVDNPFFSWIKEIYLNNASIAICRLIDDHRDSISLLKLLKEIISFPKILSRERFILLNKEFSVCEKVNPLFDRIIGKGKSHTDFQFVEWDLDGLTYKSQKIKDCRDNVIGHTDKKEFENWFCESELDECIDYIADLTKKYYIIFYGISPPDFLPKIKDKWKDIFKIPWISFKKKGSYY